jgi:hypothetical protein
MRERLFQLKGEEGQRPRPSTRQRARRHARRSRASSGNARKGNALTARVARRHRSSPKPAVANTYAASARSKRHELCGLEQDPTFEMVIP